MKFLKSDLFKLVILIILVMVLFDKFCSFGQSARLDQRLRKSNEQMSKHETTISDFKKQIKNLEKKKENLKNEKEDVKAEGQETMKKPVKKPEDVQTIVIKDTEWIPKIEYVNVYQIEEALRRAFSKYIELDIEAEDTTDTIIKKLKKVDEVRTKEVDELTADRDYFYKKAKKKFFVGFGFGFGMTYGSSKGVLPGSPKYNAQYGFFAGLVFGWKFKISFKKIKLF